jgi:hypothetical protein
MWGAIPPLPQYVFMAWYFVKYRDNKTTKIMKRNTIPNRIIVFVHS